MARLPFDMAFEEGIYLFHHVFLPPNLPQKDDYRPESERVLFDKFIDALHDFSRHVPSQDASIITTATTAVSRLRGIAGLRGDVNEEELKTPWRSCAAKVFMPVNGLSFSYLTRL